jgi:hypothetical protein
LFASCHDGPIRIRIKQRKPGANPKTSEARSLDMETGAKNFIFSLPPFLVTFRAYPHS